MNIGLWGFPVAGVAFSIAGVLLPRRLGGRSAVSAGTTTLPVPRPRSLSEYRVMRRGAVVEPEPIALPDSGSADVVLETAVDAGQGAAELSSSESNAANIDTALAAFAPPRSRAFASGHLARILPWRRGPSLRTVEAVKGDDDVLDVPVVDELDDHPAHTLVEPVVEVPDPAKADFVSAAPWGRAFALERLARIFPWRRGSSLRTVEVVRSDDAALDDAVVGEVEVRAAQTLAEPAVAVPDLAKAEAVLVAAFAAPLPVPADIIVPSAEPPVNAIDDGRPVLTLDAETSAPIAPTKPVTAPKRRIGWFGRPSRPLIVEDDGLESAPAPESSGLVGDEVQAEPREDPAAVTTSTTPFVLGMAWEGAAPPPEDEEVLVDAEAIARADARLPEFAAATMIPERPAAVVIPAWVADYEEAGVDVSEAGRVALAERLGLLEDDDAVFELRRVLMTETAPVVRGVALLMIGERMFDVLSDAVETAMEASDPYERCAAVSALAALGDTDSVRNALADADEGVVRMTVTLLLEHFEVEEVRAAIVARTGPHSDVALATVDSLL